MAAITQSANVIVDDFIAPVCHEHTEIIYQDDDILLINKPSGLLSLSGKSPLNWDSVHYRLVNGQQGVTAAFPKAILPHRLDLGTSGVMVVALNAQAAKALNLQFQYRSVKKQYRAMLSGLVAVSQGVITAPIAKDKMLFPKVKICHHSGKPAQTEFKVVKRFHKEQKTLVEFTPITGRTHQLRIHSLTFGHPILGCDLYTNDCSEQRTQRLLLHASDLFFVHPRTDKLMHGHAATPF
ncbi:RluA family pseudouridine synthase [Pseudoalteromonas sp. SCSIO 43095]|uniref:RluA family pseudouridine synthase n=1 Tax=Pseudoalteromonas sp. SCSIO 43095 TaxID=2894202 RepID=UPI00202B2A87|nr:RluA family pseudouridine synthase [Pseudoalteromonas sp. SCSIO 43095]URQ99694.1 RluA family pseudouridine synthase [Pseudoalteromonas sp. SCSIO 43095]